MAALFLRQSWVKPFLTRSLATKSEPVKTCLFDFHVSQKGKMVDFAGYSLPIQYGKEGIAASHLHARKHCAIFDVSHMLQTRIHGKDRVGFMESLTVADVLGLADNTGSLTVFTNDQGGIIDDLIVSKTDLGHLYVVSNAGCRHKDMPLMKQAEEEWKSKGGDLAVEFIDDRGLIAVQGPEAVKIVQSVITESVDVTTLPFMASLVTSVAGIKDCRITRCGYTGEDGVEISIPDQDTATVVSALLESKAGNAKMSGLGARDSLRLEAGLCLYGNDIDETTSPVEAGLTWTIGKRRRQSGFDNFPGAVEILRQIREKPSRKRVGLICHQGPPARDHTKILDASTEEEIGEVTSGCPSPSLGINVAMGYVPASKSKNGTKVSLKVRNRTVEAIVTKMPFVPSNYYRGTSI